MNKEPIGADRRRALRITPFNVEASLSVGQRVYEHIPLADISTLGIGVLMESVPEETVVKFKFKNPDLLRGLIIQAQKKFVGEQKGANGNTMYRVGFEFLFSSAQQQNLLLQWFANEVRRQLEDVRPKEAEAAKKAGGPGNIEVCFPQNEEEFEKCLDLMKPLTVHHAMMQTKFFMALEKGEILAVLPFFQDILPFHLQAEKAFPKEIYGLKAAGGRFGEIGQMALNKQLPMLQGMDLAPWYRMEILMALFQHLFFYAKHFARLTHLVAMATPSLEEFYRLWLFKEEMPARRGLFKKEEGESKSKKLVWIELESFERRAAAERSEIITWMVRKEKEGDFSPGLAYSFSPNASIIQKWFCKESRVFDALKLEEINYFRFCFPEFFSVS